MPRRRRVPVVASRGTEQLLGALGFSGVVADAVELGVVEKKKLHGRWLYFAPGVDLNETVADVLVGVEAQLRTWLAAPTPYLRHPVARSLAHGVTADAVEVIIPELIRTRRLGILPLLTNSYQPYFATYNLDDQDEIDRQVDAMTKLLAADGRVPQRALPQPKQRREADAWRTSILKHGEFLGLGRVVDAALIGWCV